MISVALVSLAVLWVAFLHQYPAMFTHKKKSNSAQDRYSYYVCGDDAPMVWRKKEASPAPKGPGMSPRGGQGVRSGA